MRTIITITTKTNNYEELGSHLYWKGAALQLRPLEPALTPKCNDHNSRPSRALLGLGCGLTWKFARISSRFSDILNNTDENLLLLAATADSRTLPRSAPLALCQLVSGGPPRRIKKLHTLLRSSASSLPILDSCDSRFSFLRTAFLLLPSIFTFSSNLAVVSSVFDGNLPLHSLLLLTRTHGTTDLQKATTANETRRDYIHFRRLFTTVFAYTTDWSPLIREGRTSRNTYLPEISISPRWRRKTTTISCELRCCLLCCLLHHTQHSSFLLSFVCLHTSEQNGKLNKVARTIYTHSHSHEKFWHLKWKYSKSKCLIIKTLRLLLD